MIAHYLTVFWRNFWRQPTYTFLNISGLSLGLASLLIIVLYVDFEMSFEYFHKKADNIYRVETKSIQTHERLMDVDWPNTPGNLAPLIANNFPEVESYVRVYDFYNSESIQLEHNSQLYNENHVAVADASLLDLFSFEFIEGNSATALTNPNEIIISENLARRIFKNDKAIGQTLECTLSHIVSQAPSNYAFKVVGVFEDTPRNTHLYNNIYISSLSDPELDNYYFNRFHVSTYLLLNDNTNPTTFAPKLTTLYDQYLDSEREPVMVHANHELVPLSNIHLNETSGQQYLYIFMGVGILLLIIIVISYVNLATAQANRRATEVGVRKVLGSTQKKLIIQFLTESTFLTFLSLIIAIGLIVLIIPKINNLFDLYLSIPLLLKPTIVLTSLLLIFIIGIIGGSYPAFVLSNALTINTLNKKARKERVRKVLISLQMATVVFVLACTSMIYNQLNFLQNKDLGFEQNNLVMIDFGNSDMMEKIDVVKEELQKSSNILGVTSSNFIPAVGGMYRRPVSAKGKTGPEAQFSRAGYVDYDYFETMNIPIVQGRNFSPDHPNDVQQSIIINRKVIENFGLEEPILGQEIRWGGAGNPNFLTVIGVIEDFHQTSLHNPIEAQFFTYRPASSQLAVKFSNNIEEGLADVATVWDQFFPDEVLQYEFLDQNIEATYLADIQRGNIFKFASILTVFLSFLGLFGLAAYLSKSRIKEVSVRKILGASIKDILILLSRSYLFLVLIVSIPSIIMAMLVIQRWLENFEFTANTNYFTLGLSIVSTLLLTLLTTGYHALSVSRVNLATAIKE
ncbi:MAG: ABC transporter permease [Bacteroidota bacterium]